MKLCFAFTFCLFSIIILKGQQNLFTKVFYEVNSSVSAYSIAKTTDNKYMICGSFNNSGLLMKNDSAGNILWIKKNIYSNFTEFAKIVSTNDSCFVLVGSCGNAVDNTDDLCYLKVNEQGNILWSYAIDLQQNEEGICMEKTNDGGFIFGGYSFLYTGSSSIVLVKTNADGAPEWVKKIDGGNHVNAVFSIKQTSDNGFILTGCYGNYIAPNYDYRAFLMKILPDGNISWAKVNSPNTQLTCGLDVQVLNSGYLCLYSDNYNGILLKTDFNGNIQWQKKLNLAFPYSLEANNIPHLRKISENKFIMVTNGFSGVHGKIDSLGNFRWQNRAKLITTDCIEANDSGIVFVGNGPLYGEKLDPPTNPQIGFLKSDSLGVNTATCVFSENFLTSVSNIDFTTVPYSSVDAGNLAAINMEVFPASLTTENRCVAVIGSVEANMPGNKSISIFPNPASNFININIDNYCDGDITIYNINGQQIMKLTNGDPQKQIDISSLQAGIYFVKALLPDGSCLMGKFAVMN